MISFIDNNLKISETSPPSIGGSISQKYHSSSWKSVKIAIDDRIHFSKTIKPVIYDHYQRDFAIAYVMRDVKRMRERQKKKTNSVKIDRAEKLYISFVDFSEPLKTRARSTDAFHTNKRYLNTSDIKRRTTFRISNNFKILTI